MKKLLSMINMLLVVIGISGCGNSAPTKVSISADEGEVVKLEVGKDIAPGEYTIQTNSSLPDYEYGVAIQKVGSKDSEIYDAFNSGKYEGSFDCGAESCLSSTIGTKPIDKVKLEDGEFLFIGLGDDDSKEKTGITEVTLTKE